MTGLIFYIDKDGNKKVFGVQGMKYTETAEDYLTSRGVEFERIIACNLDD